MASVNAKGIITMSELRFSSVHGENVNLENNGKTAAWNLNKHGGCCFTNRALAKGDKLTVNLTGSGHVLMGFIRTRPTSINVMTDNAISMDKKSHWILLRLKKEHTSVTLHLVKPKEISYTRNDGKTSEEKTITVQGKDAFICFEIRFGDISIEIDCVGGVKKPIFLDEQCGFNVALSQQQSRAQLKNINPSSTCCTIRPLQSEEKVVLDVQAVADATWTFIKIFIANVNANETQIQNLQSRNGINNLLLYPTDGIQIREKGSIQICLTKSGELSYSVNTVAQKVQLDRSIVDPSKPVYLYLELFRSRVGIRSTIPRKEVDTYVDIIENPSQCGGEYLQVIPEPKLEFPEQPPGSSCSGIGYITPIQEQHQTHPKVVDSETLSTELKRPVGISESESQSSETKLKQTVNDAIPMRFIGNQLFEKTDTVDTGHSLEKMKFLAEKPEKISGGNDAEVGDLRELGNKEAEGKPDSSNKRREGKPHERTGYLIRETRGSLVKEVNGGAEQGGLRRNNHFVGTQGTDIVRTPPRPPPPTRQETGGACGPLPLPPRDYPSGATDGRHYENEQETTFAEKIQRNYTHLLHNLTTDFLADLLFERAIMNRMEHSEYLDLRDRKGKCRYVLDILSMRPRSVGTFKEALRSTDQTYILERLQLH